MPSTIDPIPAWPQRTTQPRNVFVAAVDAFWGAIGTFRTQLLTLASELFDAAGAAEQAASDAEAAASAAEGFKDDAEAAAAYRVSIARKTYAELAAIVGSANLTAAVWVDAGTHTDPVVGGTVANAGQYRYSTSPAGWERLAALPADAAGKQDASAELTALAALTPSNDDVIQRKGGVWDKRSMAQLLADLGAAGAATKTGTETLSGKTLVMPQLDGIAIEDVYTITDGAAFVVDPANGGIQKVTLTASRVPVLTSITAGKWVLLYVDDGSAYALTLTSGSPVLKNYHGTFPGLRTTGWTPLLFIHNGSELQLWVCGNAP